MTETLIWRNIWLLGGGAEENQHLLKRFGPNWVIRANKAKCYPLSWPIKIICFFSNFEGFRWNGWLFAWAEMRPTIKAAAVELWMTLTRYGLINSPMDVSVVGWRHIDLRVFVRAGCFRKHGRTARGLLPLADQLAADTHIIKPDTKNWEVIPVLRAVL